jgi:TMEM175 potassium channel family protein
MLIPFWNTYVSQAPDNVAIKVFLSINMILIGTFSYLSMHYAASPKHRLLDDRFDDANVKTAKLQILTEPIIAAVAAGVAFIDPLYWDIAFIMIPILFATRKKRTNIKSFSYFRKKTK